MAFIGPAQFRDIFDQIFTATAALTPSAVTAGNTGTNTVTCNGAAIGDVVDVSVPAVLGNVTMQGEVTAANTVTIKFSNATAGSITPPAGNYSVVVYRRTAQALS